MTTLIVIYVNSLLAAILLSVQTYSSLLLVLLKIKLKIACSHSCVRCFDEELSWPSCHSHLLSQIELVLVLVCGRGKPTN